MYVLKILNLCNCFRIKAKLIHIFQKNWKSLVEGTMYYGHLDKPIAAFLF